MAFSACMIKGIERVAPVFNSVVRGTEVKGVLRRATKEGSITA
jgi:hypothetical protein